MVWSPAGRLFVERFREVEQQQHGDVAAVGAVAHVDARVGRGAALEVDQRAQGDVEVELGAFLLVADAHLVLRLEQIEQALQALGQRGVLGQQAVDLRRVAGRVQRFVEADPVGAVGLALVVPLRVVARRQALRFLVLLQLARLVEGFFLVAFLDEFPELAVVVAVVDHRVVEMHLGQLVALAARLARHRRAPVRPWRRADRLVEAGVEAGDEFVQHGIAVAVLAGRGRRATAWPGDGAGRRWSPDRRRLRPASGAARGRCARRPGYSRISRVSMRAVLEELDGHALEGTPVVGDLRRCSSGGGRPCGPARRDSGRCPGHAAAHRR